MWGKFSVRRPQTFSASVPTGELFLYILFYRYFYVFFVFVFFFATSAFSSSSSFMAVLSTTGYCKSGSLVVNRRIKILPVEIQ